MSVNPHQKLSQQNDLQYGHCTMNECIMCIGFDQSERDQ